jgi:cytochrome P450
MGRKEQIGLTVMRGLVRHPRLANTMFRVDAWGNIIGPDRFEDPYPIYERIRKSGPVSFSPFFQQWGVVGYDEAREILRSPSFGIAGQMELLMDTRPYSQLSEQTRSLFLNALLFTDPPLHTRLRSAVGRAFTPRQVQRLEPHVETIIDDLLSKHDPDSPMEIMSTVAQPLPVQVIAELIGVPREKWAWITERSQILGRVADPFVTIDITEIDRTCDEITSFYNDLADQRKNSPCDDLLSVLVGVETEGNLNRNELISLLVILMFAGHETTTGAIGNALVALATHSDQRRALAEQPELWPNAIEELLRYDTVLQTDPRVALEEVTIAGKTIKKGQNLTIMLGAANRDPARYDQPTQLRIDRADPAPISFGYGIHHCVGAALARLELRVALPRILDTLGDYTVNEVTWKQSLAFRSPIRLQLSRT